MHCRVATPKSIKFRSKLEFNQFNKTLTTEKLVLKSVMDALEKELGCKFIRIDPDEEDFNIFKAINEIHRHIKKSTKKSLIDEPSKKLLSRIRICRCQ